ncbi:MAG: alginate O-acetyltransferase AlgX-related protein [Phycisphaerae bacterium]
MTQMKDKQFTPRRVTDEKPPMPPAGRKRLTREEVAKIEIGHTTITRPMAWVLILGFLLTIFAVPTAQHVYDLHRYYTGKRRTAWPKPYEILSAFDNVPDEAAKEDDFQGGFLRASVAAKRDIDLYETGLEDDAYIAHLLLPPTQLVMTEIGVGNEKAFIGRGDWLFFRPGLDYVQAPGFLREDTLLTRSRSGAEYAEPPQPDPRKAILQFHQQLKARGIKLVIVPAPVKPMIHPEKYSRRFADRRTPVQNVSWDDFAAWIKQYEQDGLYLFDPAQMLMDAKFATGEDQYLIADTHWRPDAMERVAGQLATFVAEKVEFSGAAREYQREPRTVRNLGDIAVMLNLPDWQDEYKPQEVTIQQVLTRDGKIWSKDPSAEVLLLGDSFSNIYSQIGLNRGGGVGDESLNWGTSAGLAEQLSFHLQRPLDALQQNDAGSWATRNLLRRELVAGRDRLAGKKVVIWEFAARELAVGDWKLMDMDLAPAQKLDEFIDPAEKYWTPPEGETVELTGRVVEISKPERPPKPYNQMITIRMDQLQTPEGEIPGKQAIVYAWGLKDNQWMPIVHSRVDETVTVPVKQMESRYETEKRAMIPSEEMEFDIVPVLHDPQVSATGPEPTQPRQAPWFIAPAVIAGALLCIGIVLAGLITGDRRAAAKQNEEPDNQENA